ncbi:nitrilotriacetate monooxygenase component B [Rhodococcus aetherivorans]|uniref:Nitrilotriacetate monooxygenase component B n=2 Tax=Rhodococcus aetherivorans TaxID=191292 RepID=A0ABQ0YVA6_9NOCA|nr:flavin reductase domain protein FMN-binding protein [Rhodococcus rhodochrous ATCC 21198]GES40440.1 nitrilotriacetate monooxygenase component B [Rhodococcus aetherivorans]CCW13219.1 Nitrilotriacetate monooxygenase component B [Rhodococcus aetherivorans]
MPRAVRDEGHSKNGAMRTVFDPTELGTGRFYRLMTATIVPRPIAWVSTVSADGVPNVAPYSFFTVAAVTPPVVQFTSVGRKDSLRNIEETGEFVINVATVPLMERVNATSAGFAHDVDEFAAVGLRPERSERVHPPRVAEAPAAIECTLHRVIEVGDCFVVMGDVVAVSVRTDVLAEDGMPDFAALAPASRLGRNEWGLTPAVRHLDRPE